MATIPACRVALPKLDRRSRHLDMAGADSTSAAIRGPIFSEFRGAQAVDVVNVWWEQSRFERTPTDKGLNMKLHCGSTGVCTRLDGAEAAGCCYVAPLTVIHICIYIIYNPRSLVFSFVSCLHQSHTARSPRSAAPTRYIDERQYETFKMGDIYREA